MLHAVLLVKLSCVYMIQNYCILTLQCNSCKQNLLQSAVECVLLKQSDWLDVEMRIKYNVSSI